MATALNVFCNYAWLPADQAATSMAEFEANAEVQFRLLEPNIKIPNFTTRNKQFYSLVQ